MVRTGRRYTEEQIIAVLKEAGARPPTGTEPMAIRRSATVGVGIGFLHFVMSLATWIAQDRVLFEAPIHLPLAWPWQLVAFPVIPLYTHLGHVQTVEWRGLLLLLLANSTAWGLGVEIGLLVLKRVRLHVP